MTLSKRITPEQIKHFRKAVLAYYHRQGRDGRDLPWRATQDPYRILVSEFMLQQTQVERVKTKYREFLKAFPALRTLAAAPLDRVLAVWQGLGYNRRAKNILHCAREIVEKYGGRIPHTAEELLDLPGVGQSTAGAVLGFAFNQPTVFIETNIRTVFIHFFLKDSVKVTDQELIPLLEQTMDRQNPREWYYALMDYGVYLKQTGGNDPGRRSTMYKRQSPFKGSRREVRGGVLKLLTKEKELTEREISRHLHKEINTVAGVLEELVREGLLEKNTRRFRIAGGGYSAAGAIHREKPASRRKHTT
jgi:A/G-specific adenine glycosylase